MVADRAGAVLDAFRRARARRQQWESLWRECYLFAQPQRGAGLGSEFGPAERHADRLFDGTAADAAEQLAASLLAELTPPWSQWFGLRPGLDMTRDEADLAAEELETVVRRMQGAFDRSNFAVEIHQCFLDLVTVGTATFLFQENEPGATSPFRFSALPMSEVFLDGDGQGQIRRHYRVTRSTLPGVLARFPDAILPDPLMQAASEDPDRAYEIVECFSHEAQGTHYTVVLGADLDIAPILLAQGTFETSPLITFRWLKGAGELYGRSPVMTALPDVKTANKVVELILKNASIAVTGIWLAEDDGVLNPANVQLLPGSIIPKAVGSSGLTPLQAPGRFDVSELVLDDLRSRIRHTMLVDRLGPSNGPRMTATEILERSAEAARLLGAVYGRLQAELLTPLALRALSILRRRGEVPPFPIDGRVVDIEYRSPLARAQARADVQNTLTWLDTVQKLGGEAQSVVDGEAAARWLARTLGVDDALLRGRSTEHDLAMVAQQLSQAGEA